MTDGTVGGSHFCNEHYYYNIKVMFVFQNHTNVMVVNALAVFCVDLLSNINFMFYTLLLIQKQYS